MKTVQIKDYYGELQSVEVSDEVYECLCDLHREEDRLRKRIAYHHSALTPSDLEAGMLTQGGNPLEDELIRRDEAKRLYHAIEQLTPTQRRRILMLMEDMSYGQIAKAEGRKKAVVYRSIKESFLRLRLLLNS